MFKFIVSFLIVLFSFSLASAGVDTTTTSSAGAAAVIENTDNSKAKSIDKDFVISPGYSLPMLGTYLIGPTDDDSVRPIVDMLRFGDVFSESALRRIAAGGDADVKFSVVRDFEKPSNKLRDGERYIRIVLYDNVPKSYRNSAVFSAIADDPGTDSFQVAAAAALKALDNGDNILIIYRESSKRNVESSGYGIGSYVTGAGVKDSGDISGAVGGGFGFAKNKVGPEDRPWFHGYSGSMAYELPINPETVNRVRVSDNSYSGGKR